MTIMDTDFNFFLGLLIGTGIGMLVALLLSILIRDRDS